MTADVLDEVLIRFATTGPEFGPGLSNHGPMAAEALVALGRADAVAPWAEAYAQRLQEHPSARNPISAADWREALGDIARAGDWIAFFDRELVGQPWPLVLDMWVARLGPGIMAGATHGVIRTAHAVRTLSSGENKQRLHELSEGLGYWAARYQTLPGALAAPGPMSIGEALSAVPLVDEAQRRSGLIFNAVKAVEGVDFAPVLNLAAVGDDPTAFVSDLTRTFVRQYLANAGRASIAFVHSVTAPSATRILAPHLSAATRDAALRYAWQACASLYAAYAKGAPSAALAVDEPAAFDEQDLIDQAVAARDEHAIKFTEACLREYRLSGDTAFIAAAEDVVVRLRR
jgi:hypothetical protein